MYQKEHFHEAKVDQGHCCQGQGALEMKDSNRIFSWWSPSCHLSLSSTPTAFSPSPPPRPVRLQWTLCRVRPPCRGFPPKPRYQCIGVCLIYLRCHHQIGDTIIVIVIVIIFHLSFKTMITRVADCSGTGAGTRSNSANLESESVTMRVNHQRSISSHPIQSVHLSYIRFWRVIVICIIKEPTPQAWFHQSSSINQSWDQNVWCMISSNHCNHCLWIIIK